MRCRECGAKCDSCIAYKFWKKPHIKKEEDTTYQEGGRQMTSRCNFEQEEYCSYDKFCHFQGDDKECTASPEDLVCSECGKKECFCVE